MTFPRASHNPSETKPYDLISSGLSFPSLVRDAKPCLSSINAEICRNAFAIGIILVRSSEKETSVASELLYQKKTVANLLMNRCQMYFLYFLELL